KSVIRAYEEGFASPNDVNVCKRQPFRGRCPSVGGKGPARSQFVLRYYLRDNECVSYPFECEKRRQASESNLIKSDFIPICATDGSFRPLQCETQRENCFCVDHNGIKIPNSDSNSTKKPDCKRIIKAQKSLVYECLSPMDSGPCNTAIIRWYYDTRERQCTKFQYSGCGGNGNNYPTKEACKKQCKSTNNEPKCKNGFQPLRNENGQLVNCSENTCPNGYLCSIAHLGSVCCPVNASISGTSDICQLPKERGPCDQYELRFYYNSRLGECKYFFFGGCDGNANNFERVEECERVCRQRVKITTTSIISAPQLITSGPQMRKLNKEFGTKNIKKTSEEKELVELSNNDGSVNINISNDIKNINDNSATTNNNNNEANLEIGSSTTRIHGDSMINKNLSVKSSINQNESHQLQKIDQNMEKKNKQKGAKLSLDSNRTDKITNFTTVKSKNTIATVDNSEKFTASNRNEQNFASESVAVTTGQQLSNSEERMEIITATRKTTEENLLDTFISTSSISSIALSSGTTTTLQSILPTIESIIPESTANIDNPCFQKFDRGTCTGQFIRWYWDFEKSTCQVFTYSGCNGNGNNFRSREDCFAACHQP
uniref:Kunitz/Bovine pancreatic trypsin inhibitor domain-containing protein n=1 Tax=Wuchereria bancrofti TaxID=6293 RepID=A0A1I8EMT4_WUCBA